MRTGAARRVALIGAVAVTATACGTTGGGGGAGAEGGGAAEGESAEQYYADRDITMIISTAPGGGTDAQARFLAPWLSECIPGQPEVIPENVPGGGGVIGMNQFYLQEEPDGTTVVVGGIGPNLNYVFGEPTVEYDYSQMEPLAGAGTGAVIYTANETGVQEPADLFQLEQPLKMGHFGSPVGSPLPQLLAVEVLGLSDDVEMIFGYEGTGPARLAFMQGELNINSDTTSTIYDDVIPQAVDTGQATLLFSLGVVENGDIVTDPDFPDLPTVKEVYEEQYGESPSGEAWEGYIASMAAGYSLQKIWWTHGDAPEAAIEALHEGMRCVVEDEEFVQAAEEAQVFDKDLVIGEELHSGIDDMLGIDEQAKEWTLDWLREEYDLTW